jgi:hypothetical protein
MSSTAYLSYSRLDKLGKVADWTTTAEPTVNNPIRKKKEEKQDFISVDRQLASLRKLALKSTKPVLKKVLKTKYTKTVGYATKTLAKARDCSIKVSTGWDLKMELDFNRMAGLYLAVDEFCDLYVCGIRDDRANIILKNIICEGGALCHRPRR